MKAVTLLYHDAVEDNDYDSSGFPGVGAAVYKLNIDDMKSHFEAVATARTGRPSNVYDLLKDGAREPHPFLITFDDGGLSAAIQIADLLDQFGWTGHFFITTDYIGKPTFVNAEQIRELRKRGHIVGSHSCSHPSRMSYCGWDELMSEWGKSVDKLSSITGEKVDTASVPGGYFSNEVARAASACGIKALFTSEPVKRAFRVDDCLVLGRYTLFRGMPPDISAALSSESLSADQIKQYVNWNFKKAAKKIGGKYYVGMRSFVLGSRC